MLSTPCLSNATATTWLLVLPAESFILTSLCMSGLFCSSSVMVLTRNYKLYVDGNETFSCSRNTNQQHHTYSVVCCQETHHFITVCDIHVGFMFLLLQPTKGYVIIWTVDLILHKNTDWPIYTSASFLCVFKTAQLLTVVW